MRIRPGRTRSLIAGIAALAVMVFGLVMMGRMPGGGIFGPFMILWVLFGLIGAAAAFYNAFSERGLPLYEVDTESEEGDAFCPQCGRPVSADDAYCRRCGASLDE